MKKTVQIVTILLGKEEWSKGDLCICTKPDRFTIPVGTYKLADIDKGFDPYQCGWQPQQLLVLCDDEIQSGDYFLEKDITENFDKAVINKAEGCIPRCWIKKIVASYPTIEGTLPISKETIQQWIDSGTPEEGSVEIQEIDVPVTESIRKYFNEYKFVEKLNLDPQGNLLLEFGEKKKMLQDISSGASSKWQENAESHREMRELAKPSIPTNEEIEEKAESYALQFLQEDEKETDSVNRKMAYKEGYKQTLKDLGL